ncbi:type II secretion system protein [Evansella halocellulosilytica]|uniref:type II secretion system protein n=1 Tax=Evansella halocellulosilytica TaxID=2011013 RepID=UPI000BB7F699|nr:type II secretion system protein [Evansella halocellulosilytica]
METLIIILFVTAILLFVLSFFRKDPAKEMEKQLENFSIQFMQELYQVKKKVEVLEEEYMIPSTSPSSDETESKLNNKPLTRDDVLSMYEEGYSVQEIASFTDKSEQEIEEILANVS